MYKTFYTLIIFLLFTAYLTHWISEQLYTDYKIKKYLTTEQREEIFEENTEETKTKIIFTFTINTVNVKMTTETNQIISSCNLFRAKEYVIKNTTPPPRTSLVNSIT